jgi:hypothetical protein
MMVTTAWKLGFRLVELRRKGRICRSEYCRDNIRAALIRLRPEAGGRILILHAGNATVQRAQKDGTGCAEKQAEVRDARAVQWVI